MRILVADDDDICREGLTEHLEYSLGHEVTSCADGDAAFRLYRKEPFPLVLSDIRMPGLDGISLLKKIKELPEGANSDIVLITGFGDISSAIEAMRAGAFDYILKPVNLRELDVKISRTAEHQSLLRENYDLTRHFEDRLFEATLQIQERLNKLQKAYAEKIGLDTLGIYSEGMKKVVEMTRILHRDRAVPVIIEGETGTGKELVAKLIHYGIEGNTVGPFVCINCSAISENLFESELFGYEGGAYTGAKAKGSPGKLEMAQGGTLLLDEIGDLPLEMQPKLLRVLQEKEFYRVGGLRKHKMDVRIICASNRNLNQMVKENRFRSDLYFRLNLGCITILPLRRRREEIEPLAMQFLLKAAEQKKRKFRGFHEQALAILRAHDWPGNVRELQHAIERVVLLHDDEQVRPEHLRFIVGEDDTPTVAGGHPGFGSIYLQIPEGGMSLKAIEKEIIRRVLELFDNNKTKAASCLGLSRGSLRRKME